MHQIQTHQNLHRQPIDLGTARAIAHGAHGHARGPAGSTQERRLDRRHGATPNRGIADQCFRLRLRHRRAGVGAVAQGLVQQRTAEPQGPSAAPGLSQGCAVPQPQSQAAPWLQLQLGPQPQPQPQVQRGSFRAVGAEAQQQPRRATVATDWCGVMGFSLVWGGSGGSEWGKARCHQLAASCRLESPGVLCTGFRWPPSPAAAANCHSQVPQPSPTANCRCQLPQRTAAADRRRPGPDSRLSPSSERLRSDRPGAWIHPVRRHFKARGPMPWKRSQPGCA